MIGLLDSNGNEVVRYAYNDYGLPVMRTGTLADTLGLLNPFRYRGYVYDDETQLYYLRSRYYNPYRGRFINADIEINTNGFSYCCCEPINCFDPSGYHVEYPDSMMEGVSSLIVIDITDKLMKAMEEHYNELNHYDKTHLPSETLSFFIDKVRTGGEWDLKNSWNLVSSDVIHYVFKGIVLRSDEPGYIHFGYVGFACFPSFMLKIGGGIYQIFSGTSRLDYLWSFFDDPLDTDDIEYGYLLRNKYDTNTFGYNTLDLYEQYFANIKR